MPVPASLRHFFLLVLVFLLLIAFGFPRSIFATRFFFGGTTTRVSVASDGIEGNNTSNIPSVSGDGRYVAFISLADNLVANDTNASFDIFLYDRQTGETSRVSVASGGIQGNDASNYPFLSYDGQYVAFDSRASNLILNDNNSTSDIFIHNSQTGQTNRISIASDGTEGNGDSYYPSLSVDGRYVTFHSDASNLVANDTNNAIDVFVHDRQTGQTSRVSVTSEGVQGNSESSYPRISADGRYVGFVSYATNLIANDTNGVTDIFVHDRQTGQTNRVSIASNGLQGNLGSFFPALSANGQYVTFESSASNLVNNDTNGEEDIFVHNGSTGITERVSIGSGGVQGNETSLIPDLSVDGRYIVYSSYASNLVAGDINNFCEIDGDNDFNENCPDFFIHDRLTGETSILSISTQGIQGDSDYVHTSSISDDGSIVVFASNSSNLVVGDTNEATDVFVRERFELTPTPTPTTIPNTLTPTPTEAIPTATPTLTGITATATATGSPTRIVPTLTSTPTDVPSTSTPTSTTIVTTYTPTRTPTIPVSNGEVYIPLVLRQYAFATPMPTATPTNTPLPTCEVLDHEPNNFFSQANANLPLCEGGTVIGSVSTNDIDDYYRFQLDNAGTVRIDLTGIPVGADYDLYLYDASGGPVAVSNNSGSVNETIRTQIASGRYYIRVYSLRYAQPNTYQLRWGRE